MATVLFPSVLVLNTRYGQSQRGNAYVSLQFLDEDTYQVFDVMQFGDEQVALCMGLSQGSRCSLGFDVVPDRSGGVRLVASSVGAV